MQNYKTKFQKRYKSRKETNHQWNTILQLIEECEINYSKTHSVNTNQLEKCLSILCNQQYPIKSISNDTLADVSMKLLPMIQSSTNILISQYCSFLTTICLKQKPNFTSKQISQFTDFFLTQLKTIQKFFLNDLLKVLASFLEHYGKLLISYYSPILSSVLSYIRPDYTDLGIKQLTLSLLLYICNNAMDIPVDDYTTLYNHLIYLFQVHKAGLYQDPIITKLLSTIIQCLHSMISTAPNTFLNMKTDYPIQELYTLLLSILKDSYKIPQEQKDITSQITIYNKENKIPSFIIQRSENEDYNSNIDSKFISNLYILLNTLFHISININTNEFQLYSDLLFYLLYNDSNYNTIIYLLQILYTIFKSIRIDKWLLYDNPSTSSFKSKSDTIHNLLFCMNSYILLILEHYQSIPSNILNEICKIIQLLYKSNVYISASIHDYSLFFNKILSFIVDILTHNDQIHDKQQNEILYNTLTTCFTPISLSSSKSNISIYVSQYILTPDFQNTTLMNYTFSYYQSIILPCQNPNIVIEIDDIKIQDIQFYTPPSYVVSFLSVLLTYHTSIIFYYWNSILIYLTHSFQLFDIPLRVTSIEYLSSLLNTKSISYDQFPPSILKVIIQFLTSLLYSNIKPIFSSITKLFSSIQESQFQTVHFSIFIPIIHSFKELLAVKDKTEEYYIHLLQAIQPLSIIIANSEEYQEYYQCIQYLLQHQRSPTIISICYSLLCSLSQSTKGDLQFSSTELFNLIQEHYTLSESIQINILRFTKYLLSSSNLSTIQPTIKLFLSSISYLYENNIYNKHYKLLYNIDYFIQSFFIYISDHYEIFTKDKYELNLCISLKSQCIQLLIQQYDSNNLKLKTILFNCFSSLSSFDLYGTVLFYNIYQILKKDIQFNINHSTCLYNTLYTLTLSNQSQSNSNAYLLSIFHFISHLLKISPASFLNDTITRDHDLFVQFLNFSLNNVTDYLSSDDYIHVQQYISTR